MIIGMMLKDTIVSIWSIYFNLSLFFNLVGVFFWVCACVDVSHFSST